MKLKICCKICKKEFFVWPSNAKKGRKYCNFTCRDNDPCFIEKISKGKMGKKNPNWKHGLWKNNRYVKFPPGFREKYNARHMTYYWLKKGKIVKKACEFCGSNKVQAHHEDYKDVLNVRWFCPKHHTQIHHPL